MRHHATQQPRRLGGLPSRLVFALAVAALPGCGEHNATEPEVPVEESAADLANDPSALAPAATGSLNATATATRLPRSFFVNPQLGSDGNPGTQLKPFKTLAHGLSLAIAGDTMRLAPGLYSAASNGEKFTTSTRQVVVPAGVKIFGTLQVDERTTLHGAPGDLVGLSLQGAATVRNLDVTGFPTGVTASQGVQSFKNVVLEENGLGLKLGGSAKATLTASAVFVRPGVGSLGASVAKQAQLTLVGGRITAGGPNCAAGIKGVSLVDAARLTMKNGATLTNIAGTALEMRQTSKATLTGLAKIERDFSTLASCTPLPGVNAFDSTSLTLKSAQILSTGGTAATGIFWESRGPMTLDSARVKGYSLAGLDVRGNLKLVATNSVFQLNGVGINVIDGPNSSITITRSTISSNVIGIHGTGLKLRRSLVTGNQQTGILLSSASGNDLGQTFDPGINIIGANGITGVAYDGSVTGGGTIFASGNSWTPKTQGSDGSGRYPQMVVTGTTTNPPASGKNFTLPPFSSFKIQL